MVSDAAGVSLTFDDSGASYEPGTPLRAGFPSVIISSRKSITTCPFIALLREYDMSYAPNSTAHLDNLPDVFRLLKIYFMGLSVMTLIVWAWKYLLNLLAACTNANASFSITP
ncbi:hypothetical protein Tco_1133541 [Tanacetum coccineum]